MAAFFKSNFAGAVHFVSGFGDAGPLVNSTFLARMINRNVPVLSAPTPGRVAVQLRSVRLAVKST
jgi:hypothetical protein